MVVKRKGSFVTVESPAEKTLAEISYFEEKFSVKITQSGEERVITRPGEYEYFKIAVTAIELPEKEYHSKIDVLRLNVEGMELLFHFSRLEIVSDILKSMPNITILFMPVFENSFLKKNVSEIGPLVLCLVPPKQQEIEEVKKVSGYSNLTLENSLKYKLQDFGGDDQPLQICVLN